MKFFSWFVLTIEIIDLLFCTLIMKDFFVLDKEVLFGCPHEYHNHHIHVGVSKHYTTNIHWYYVYLNFINILYTYGKIYLALFRDSYFYILIYPSQCIRAAMIMHFQYKLVYQILFYEVFPGTKIK